MTLGLFSATSVEPTWNISAVSADQFWSVMNYRGENISIAIIDSGVNYSLPDLYDNYLGGYDFVNNDSDPMDDYYHGTACASIAVGQGVYAYEGVAPKAGYYALKVLDNHGIGDPTHIASAITWAVDHGADIISLSLGGPYSQQVEIACQNAYSKNVTIVAAVGNLGYLYPDYPAGYGSVIAVGAYTESGGVWPDSQYGCDLIAPGGDQEVPALHMDGTVINFGMTSAACPHVAGAVALWMSKFGKWPKNTRSTDEVRQILKVSAAPLAGVLEWHQGAGLLNCSNMRFRRGFVRNAGFESAEPFPWQQYNSSNIDFEWIVTKNGYPTPYEPGLGGDCHLEMKLNTSTGNQDFWLMSYYDYSDFLGEPTCERGKNATRNLDGVFSATSVNAETCDLAKVAVRITFYLASPATTKIINYCWYAKGIDANATDQVYFVRENLASGYTYSFSRDVRSDFNNAFGFQLNGSWQIVYVMILTDIVNATSQNRIDILVGETRLHGNYINVTTSDINNDEKVNAKDVAAAAHAFGTRPGDAFWDPRVDITGPTPGIPDVYVDARDVSEIASHFGT